MTLTADLAGCALMMIDDEEANLDLLEALLRSEGYERITRVSSSANAARAFDETMPDLVLLDLHMPHPNGFEILEQFRRSTPPDDYLPVLVLTADITSEARDRALSNGANDFVTKPFDAVEVLLRVRNLLETRLLHREQRRARLAAEAAERRARLLAEASHVLTASLDSETGLAQLAHLLVPEFASSCAFAIVEDDGFRWLPRVEGPGRSTDFDRPRLEAELSRRLATGGSGFIDGADGRTFVAPMSAPSGPVGAILVTPRADPGAGELSRVLVEIAARAALAIENARLFARAQHASRSRERLLSVVAHDLRSPLAVVTMYAEMLLDLVPPDEDGYTADALASIYKSTHRMQQQVEDLLDLGRFQDGAFAIRPTESSIEEIFGEAEMVLRPLASARSIELIIESPEDPARGTVEVDSLRLQQVLSNLVGNAIKFSPDGSQVTLGWEVGDAELHGWVSDSGPGIVPDQMPHLFGAFWQARDADRRGLGLGLWIARAIIEAHHGKIRVDSEVRSGATFHFHIPLRQPETSDRPTAAEPGLGLLTHAPPPMAE